MKTISSVPHLLSSSFLFIVFATISGFSDPGSLEKPNTTDVSVTHLDISLKADFQSNSVQAVVKAEIENASQNAIASAEFWICPGGWNDSNFGSDVKHIYLLEDNGKNDLSFTIRKIDDTWESYKVEFPKSLQLQQKISLQFEYTMTGKSDYSSSPILMSDKGIKEIYLRGSDYLWCPTPYHDIKGHARVNAPEWTLRIEYPAGYIAVTEGDLLNRVQKEETVIDEWKSLKPGWPRLYTGPYKVVKQTCDGRVFEIYTSDETILRKASEKLEKYIQMYRLYSDLYGDPESSFYRFVGSSVTGVGASFDTGQMIDMNRMEEIHHIAHEMAHTWWGGMVSTHGVGHKFLSEAMAEFSARWVLQVMEEKVEEDKSLSDGNILGWKQRQFCCYLAPSEPPRKLLAPLIFQEGYDSGMVTGRNYFWGPLVVNQIRLILGDEVFFRCLKAFIDQYKGSQVGIDEFVQTINTVSGRDMTAELKGLLWSTGFASYRLLGFESVKAKGGYTTKVRIKNEGDYGITCPLLLKTAGGEKRMAFLVDAHTEKEFVYPTVYKVIDVVIDPDSTTLVQYYPDQKLRLWQAMLEKMEECGNNEAYGKSYLYYAKGELEKAVDPISDYMRDSMKHKKVNNIGELLKKDGFFTQYVFMRGVFYLALDDLQHAEEDIENAFPYMLQALVHKEAIRAPDEYYEVGAIKQKDLGEYLALLKLIAGREFSFENAPDEAAKKQKIGEWKQWWEKEGRLQEFDFTALKKLCETNRKTALTYN